MTRHGIMRKGALLAARCACALLWPDIARSEALTIPSVQISFGDAEEPQQVARALQIVFLLTVLTLAPSILIMTTSFTRITAKDLTKKWLSTL